MARWVIADPTTLDLDELRTLKVRIASGQVAVLATHDRPRLEVSDVVGPPLLVDLTDGTLTATYEDLTWDGLLSWLRPRFRRRVNLTVAVPEECAVQLGVVMGSALVAGVSSPTTVRNVSGDILLDGVTGRIDAQTVSGSVEARDMGGDLKFTTVSGDLLVAGGRVHALATQTVSGKVLADVELDEGCEVRLITVSGEIAIRIPPDADARVELRTTSGKADSDFPGLDRRDIGGMSSLSGRLGAGAGTLTATTMSGDVTLLRRGPRPAAHSRRAS